jgi:hypothetical protein
LPASSVTITDVGGHLNATTAEEAIQEICGNLSAARDELDALLAPHLHQFAILPSFPNTSSSMYEGMAVYSLADKNFACCKTVGEHEIDRLTVETGAVTAAGDITIELNGTAIVVAVELDDTAVQVAVKIKAAVDAAIMAETIGNWTVSVDGADILFIKDTVGACVAPTATDTGLTGVTFSAFARDNEGVDTVWASFLA